MSILNYAMIFNKLKAIDKTYFSVVHMLVFQDPKRKIKEHHYNIGLLCICFTEQVASLMNTFKSQNTQL